MDCAVTDAAISADNAYHLEATLSQLGCRFRMSRHGNRSTVERVSREVKHRTSSFSNTFSYAQSSTAECWLQTFAACWSHACVSTTERFFRQFICSLSANDIDFALRVFASSRRISIRSQPSDDDTLDGSDQLCLVVRGTAGLGAAFLNQCEPIGG